MGNTFTCGLCKNVKNVSEIKRILFDENIWNVFRGYVCNNCFYTLKSIFYVKKKTDHQNETLLKWGVTGVNQ